MSPKPNRSELAVLRGKTGTEAVSQWVQAFAEGDPEAAARYQAIVSRFTGQANAGSTYEPYMGGYSPGTRRTYAFALTEFFEWIATKHGRIVPPPQVTRKDAEDYVQWLITRPYSLEGERLRDGDQPERLALYEIVRSLGSTDIHTIAARAPSWLVAAHPSRSDRSKIDVGWLHRELGRMVLHDLLVRSPTMDELRKQNSLIGVVVFTVSMPIDGVEREVPLEDVFSYTMPVPRPVSRSTVLQRLAALAAFWNALAEGENATSAKGFVRYNIFSDLAHRVRRGHSADTRAARARKGRLTPQMVERLLRAADGPSVHEKRDAALLWFLVLTGARITETTRVRRGIPPSSEALRWPGWFDARANPPTVELVRKGGFRQRIPYPPYALQALYAFQAELARHAALDGMQSDDPRRPHYLPATSPAWRYKALAEQPDAPLFPPVNFWGANSTHSYEEFKPNTNVRPDYRRAMSRHGLDAMLKRIARKAEFTEEEVKLVHGHAFRHFAATAMSKQGKPLREIQHILGHDSIVTTERYVEPETTTEALSGQDEILSYIARAAVREPPAPPSPHVPAQPPQPKVVQTHGMQVPDRPRPVQKKEPRREKVSKDAGLPAQAPRVAPDVIAPKEERLVAIAPEGIGVPPVEMRDGVSPPTPIEAYAGHAPPKLGPQTEEERLAQQEPIAFTVLNVRKPSGESRLANLAGNEPVEKGVAVIVTKTGRRGTVVSVPRRKKGEERTVIVEVAGKAELMPATAVHRDLVQQNAFLRKNYDPWPVNYGIGEGSLLPWFAIGSASANGEVQVVLRDGRSVYVPPIPVLAPAQTDPALAPQHAKLLWDAVDDMRTRWLRSAPTKAFGLDRWWGSFLHILRQLQTVTRNKYRWVPFDAPATLGKDIRAHDEQYLVTWLEINADRYTATVRAFEDIARLRGVESGYEIDPEEWLTFQRAWRDASVVGISPAEDLPEWFIVDDPVRDIYDKSPEEWEWFSKWIGAVTGQKLTDEREKAIKTEATFVSDERAARIKEARALLDSYYGTVNELRDAVGADRTPLRNILKLTTEKLVELGVPDPAKMLKEGRLQRRQSRKASVEQLLAMAFPEADVSEIDPNVLKSALFDADTLRLDMSKKTISHTPEFREEFAERYDGRDSECVVRRATRGMWEHVKRHGIPLERGSERSSEYSLLYSVMLSYMAWIFPCPEEIERRMAKEIADGKQARLTWLQGVRRTGQRIVRLAEDKDEAALRLLGQEEGLDRQSTNEAIEAALVADSLRAEVALPPPEQAVAEAAKQVKAGTVISMGPAGMVIRRRGSAAPQHVPAAEERTRPVPAPVARQVSVPEVRASGRARVHVVEPRQAPLTHLTTGETEEAESAAAEAERAYDERAQEVEEMMDELMVRGGEPEDYEQEGGEDDLNRNAPPPRYITRDAFAAGSEYIANVERALPSAIRMMAAMTLRFTDR
jgi:integrase